MYVVSTAYFSKNAHKRRRVLTVEYSKGDFGPSEGPIITYTGKCVESTQRSQNNFCM